MGFGTRSCMVFCYLNAVCAVFIGYLFSIGINSLAIVSAINNWDRQEKARACRNAGILYFVVALAMTVKNMIDTRRERRQSGSAGQRIADYSVVGGAASAAETVPLLDRRAFVRGDATGSSSRRGPAGYGGVAS
ncbi:hypothetical protein NESM_000843300 [Novymonas esmeraldas]|uniref:Uncharacterized protein n=1 Tax=Novymonas esmeraldas TaxID=1808958 RepID=A0AAW0F0T5_9TRYP